MYEVLRTSLEHSCHVLGIKTVFTCSLRPSAVACAAPRQQVAASLRAHPRDPLAGLLVPALGDCRHRTNQISVLNCLSTAFELRLLTGRFFLRFLLFINQNLCSFEQIIHRI